jgi:hypothetical protein
MLRKRFDISLDFRSIAVFRIALALLLIVDLLLYKMPFAEVFYSDSGVLDNQTFDQLIHTVPNGKLFSFGLLSFISSVPAVKLFFAVALCVYGLLLAGVFSRVSAIISFVMLWSIHQRNPYVLSGPDELLINLLFIAIILPTDQRFSLVRMGEKREGAVNGPTAFYALFFVGMTYFFQAFLKEGDLWKNGQALSYAMMETLWTKPMASAMIAKTELCAFLSRTTIWLEYAVPLLIFFPFRNGLTRGVAIVLILFFHWSIFLFFDVGILPWIATGYAILLMPVHWWNWLMKRWNWPKTGVRSKQFNPKISWRGSLIFQRVSLSIMLVVILWGSFLVSERMQEILPNPEFMKTLQKSSLFRQNWGFYAPDPSTVHGWCKVAGITSQGEMVDMRTLKKFRNDSGDLENYQNYSWQVFVYRTCIYSDPLQRRILDNWARYEFEQAKKLEQADIIQVQLVRFTTVILAPGKSTPLAISLAGYAPAQ